MTNTNTYGQSSAIQRYKIGYRCDEWGMRSSTPGGLQDESGSWVLYSDHIAVIAACRARIAELEEINTQLCEQADVAANAHAALQAQLVKEAARTAEEKLRADQMSKQHDMQSKMHQEAMRKLAVIAAQAKQGEQL